MERPHHKLLVGTVNCVCKRWQLAFRWGIETGWRCVYMCVSLCERDTVVSERERERLCAGPSLPIIDDIFFPFSLPLRGL